jgi:acyl dehydratase
LESRLGRELGVSDWHLATQEDIDDLALAPVLMDEVVSLQSFAFVVNAGLDRICFPAPLPVGDRVRLRLSLEAITSRRGGRDVTFLLCFECPSQRKPVCLAESVVRVFDTC